jgi:hypothetical protein
MATTTSGTYVDDDAFDDDDDRYDTLVLPPDVQQAIDQVRCLYVYLSCKEKSSHHNRLNK